MKSNYNENFDGRVYYSGPFWDNKEIDAAVDALKNGKWLSSGEKVHKFEREFSKKFKVGHSVMVNSGSSANLVMIAGLKERYGWNDDDEIIVSPVGFPTTIAPIYQNRLKPVFVDIEMNTLNFDLKQVEDKITPRTVGIFLSPVLGNPPNMDDLEQILLNHPHVKLIGDNCDSLGSEWNKRYLGQFCVAWSSSFYPAHHITTGEGGMVSTDDKKLHDIFRSFTCWGRDCYCVGAANLLPNGTCKNRFSNWLEAYDGEIDHKYIFTHMGYNLKPLDLQGAIGLEQLKKFKDIWFNRVRFHTRIFEKFNRILGLHTVKVASYKSLPCWFGVPLFCDFKKELVNHLESNGVQTRNYFAGNILMHPGFSFLDDYKKYPNANTVLDKVFFVGCSPSYTEDHFNHIEKVLNEFAKQR